MAQGYLTTHVLDTAHGRPASGMRISLESEEGGLISVVVTNANGRSERPVLEGEAFKVGRYRLIFEVGDYFRKFDVTLPEVAFLEHVPVDFGIDAVDEHYHVPLLVSPYGYSTYRGS